MSDRKQSSGGDSELDRDLALTSRAYKNAEADFPALAMDDAIRAAARRAVKSQPQAVGKSWLVRYSAPLSAAALVMLTVSIGFIALDERPELAPALVNEGVRPSAAVPAPTVVPAPETALPEVIPSSRSLPAAQAERAARERSAYAARAGPATTESVQRPSEAAVAAPVAVAKVAPSFVADPAADAVTRPQKFAENVELSTREMSQERAVGGMAGSGLAARNDVPRHVQKTTAQAPATAVASKSVVAPPANAPAAPLAPIASMADKADEPPEQWLKRILEFKRAGRTREFEEELAKYRKRYPDYLLPEELKGQK